MKKIKLIDFDSTMITKETLDVLAAISLIGQPDEKIDEIVDAIKSITAAGMNGDISFEDSLSMRLSKLNLHRVHVVQTAQYLSLSHNISPSFTKYRDAIQQDAENIYIISGGFKEIIMPVAEYFGIAPSHVFANEFRFDTDGNYLGIDEENSLAHEGGKVKIGNKLRDEGKLPYPVIAIGDGMTDWQLWEAGIADTFIAFTETAQRESVMTRAERIEPNLSRVVGFLGWQQPGRIEAQRIFSGEMRYATPVGQRK